jgi:hypothetical protein
MSPLQLLPGLQQMGDIFENQIGIRSFRLGAI